MTAAERAGLPQALYNFFTFGPEHKAGFAPVAFLDFGFLPSVGLYLFWTDAFFKGHDLHFHGSVWTSDWLAGSFSDRIRFEHGEVLTTKLVGIRRPDHAFFGIGPSTLDRYRSRYTEDLLDATIALDVPFGRSSHVKAETGMRSANLSHGHFGHDPSVEQEAATGAFAVPFGFDRGYTAQRNEVVVVLDSRKSVSTGSGARLEATAEQGSDVRRAPGGGWIRYGATAGVFWDLNDYGRVVSLSAAARFADPLGSQPIPFPELVSVGGDELMRGFVPGRLVDRSAAVATLRYRWPIGFALDGSMQAAVGNVFGVQLEQLTPGLLRFSGAVGVETVGSTEGSLQILFGLGTETFDHGGQLDSIRFVVGTNRGF
jgi:hypothetical protein